MPADVEPLHLIMSEIQEQHMPASKTVCLSCCKFKLTAFKLAYFSNAIAAVPEMTNCMEKRKQNMKFSDSSIVGRYTIYPYIPLNTLLSPSTII